MTACRPPRDSHLRPWLIWTAGFLAFPLLRPVRTAAAPARPPGGRLTDAIRAGRRARMTAPRHLISGTGSVAAAIRHLLDGKARGKLAVSVSPGRLPTPATGSTP